VPTVARELLGKLFIRRAQSGTLLVGRIVETEAYAGASDAASHAYRGRTKRNGSMFLPAGHAYVYHIYGLHNMLNVVTSTPESPSAVLIRGLEAMHGLEATTGTKGLLRGPARVTTGLAIDRALDGHDLALPPLQLVDGPEDQRPIVVTTRIGLSRSLDPVSAGLAWRFYLLGSDGVSRRDRAAERSMILPTAAGG
jgi:DNA-3-methyladenine glycosylase